jgi:precorrin-6A/cobalt-precorrin-6A reductase
MTRILLLGGTTEALALAGALSGRDAIYSLAGRTEKPVAQPLPQRVGGFGGVAGLVEFLRSERITHVVDATHPFAAEMSRNAVQACEIAEVSMIALERPEWVAGPGDRWHPVAHGPSALPVEPRRIFLAVGRQTLGDYAVAPQHSYLVRLVDAPNEALALPQVEIVTGRGPFALADDLALMRRHGTELVVTKNSGGDGARAKLDAARILGIGVIMINRPPMPERRVCGGVAEVMDWLHDADLGVKT